MKSNEIELIIDSLIKAISSEEEISDATLLKVCSDLDLSHSFCKFQYGIHSALEYIAENFDSAMQIELKNFNLKDMKIRERVKLAIHIRLLNYSQLPNYRELLKNVLSFSFLPRNIYYSNQILYKTISNIWYAINDNSTDFNYYTKRAILAGAYLSTIFFFTNDYSKDFINTLSFLDNRINNIMILQNLKSSLKNLFFK